MDTQTGAIPGRKDFLLRIVEQFRDLAAGIGAPFSAEAYIASDEAVLRIERAGQEESVLRLTARFIDDPAVQHKLVLLWENSQGEVTKILGLGWTVSLPDPAAGLDSQADVPDGDISTAPPGYFTHVLQTLIERALRPQPGITHHPAINPRHAAPSALEPEPLPRALRRANLPQSTKQRTGNAPAPLPNINLLQSALGELATQLGLTAEKVFAGFIEASASAAPLKQGDIAAYAQGAIIEVALCYNAFLDRPAIRASDLGMEPLRHAVVKAKATLFENDEPVRRQFAREMVAGMRLYYAEALAHRGVPDGDAKEMLKTTFGRDAAIVTEAIAILPQTAPAKNSLLPRLFGRNGLE